MDEAVPSGGPEQRRAVSSAITLAPELSSAPAARHWVTAQLDTAPDDVRQTAALLASELVTNAVLHAATPVTVRLVHRPGTLRVEVSDDSPAMPANKEYGAEAATGRGLTVIEALSDAWGTSLEDPGKKVWFELGVPSEAEAEPVTPPPTTAEPGRDDLVPMSLLGVPVTALLRASAAYEELFREFRLVVEREPAQRSDAIQVRLLALVDELGTRFAGFTAGAELDWQAAVRRGTPVVDLHYRLPREVGPVCARYDDLLDEADAFCKAAALLTLAAPPDVVALRKWVLGEFAWQSRGAPPTPWKNSAWARQVDNLHTNGTL